MLSVAATDKWVKAHPGGTIGLLELYGIQHTLPSGELERQKRATEAHLRELYQGNTQQDFLALPVMAAYDRYYKRFNKTYHVLLQVESIVLKGKNLPNVSPLVDANFMSEVETFILTAGHDVAKLRGPVCIDTSVDGDSIVQMNGAAKTLYAGDMIMRDLHGVCCSVIYGQDQVSPISGAPRMCYTWRMPRRVFRRKASKRNCERSWRMSGCLRQRFASNSSACSERMNDGSKQIITPNPAKNIRLNP